MIMKLLPLIYKMSGHAVYVIAGFGVVVGVDFQNKITLGSLLVAAVLIILAGIFTVRSKIAAIWREEAEGERAAKERCQQELADERADRAEFEKQQQELRHQLKNEIVGLQATIKVLEAKTDLSAAVTAIQSVSEASGKAVADQISTALTMQSERSEKRDQETQQLLVEIRDKLPHMPVTVTADDPLPVHEVDQRKG